MNDRARPERDVRLLPMPEHAFDVFVERAIREFARDKVRCGQWREVGAAELARQAMSNLLPAGMDTPGHHLYVVLDAASGRRIGTAWLHLDRAADPPFAYLYDIRIDDDAQGQGFGRAALHALERAAADAGCRSLRLHTFGHNERARRLYESAGYRMTNINMRKDLG